MAHQVKAVNNKPDDLSSVPEIHMGGREQTAASYPPTSTHALCMHVHTYSS